MCRLVAYIYDSCCHRGPRGDCEQLSKCDCSDRCLAETNPTDIQDVTSKEGFCPTCREKRAQGLPTFKYRTRKINGSRAPYDWSADVGSPECRALAEYLTASEPPIHRPPPRTSTRRRRTTSDKLVLPSRTFKVTKTNNRARRLAEAQPPLHINTNHGFNDFDSGLPTPGLDSSADEHGCKIRRASSKRKNQRRKTSTNGIAGPKK